MKKIILILLAVIFTASSAFAKEIWYCPMHPDYISDRKGQCPICGMNLVKKQDKASVASNMNSSDHVHGYVPVTIKKPMQAVMGLETVKVLRKSLIKNIRAPGNLLHKGQSNWVVNAEVLENDISFVSINQLASVEIPSNDLSLKGYVRFVDYDVDPITRTVKVQVQLPAVQPIILRANTYVSVVIPYEFKDALVVPRDSVMMTGTRAIVFVVGKDDTFTPKEVKVGLQSENLIQIKEGLKEGQKIVSKANFLIDSESRMQGAFSDNAMNMQGAGHEQHK